MDGSPRRPVTFSEPFLPRHPWRAALLLGTVATPAAVILAVPAPRPLDALLAWPLVLFDIWLAPGGGAGPAGQAVPGSTPVQVAAFAAGVMLTWAHYIVLARLILWRALRPR
jgi:hypothetical protein